MSKPNLKEQSKFAKSISGLDREISHTIDMRDSFLSKGKIDQIANGKYLLGKGPNSFGFILAK
jgi:hypothetical protein